MTLEQFLVVAILFFAVFTQSLTGFGVALVSMPLLTGLLGIRVATPLVALVAVTTEMLLVLYFRRVLNLRAVWQLAAASLFGIPLGVLALRRVEEEITLTLLGLVIAGYALYALLNFELPTLEGRGWAYGLGFLAGLLGGAYNTSGPPVIIYGQCRRWPPAEFKGNLQGFFVVISILVAAGHAWDQNLTAAVWRHYWPGLIGIGLGMGLGLWLGERVNPATFRRLVLWLLIVLGLRLMF